MRNWKVFETLQSKSGLVLAQVEYTFPSQGVAQEAHDEMHHVQLASSVKYVVKDAADDQS
jgi:hypothetical protein